MVDLIYSVPTWLLGLLIVSLSAGLPVLGLLIVRRRVPTDVRRTQNDIAGYISNIAAFVYAVLLAFLAVAVWQNYQSVQVTVELETNAATDVFRQAQAYPAPFARRVRDNIRQYVDLVIRDEWPLQARGRESEAAWRTLQSLHHDILTFQPGDQREHIIHAEQIRVMKSLRDQRRNRIYASTSGLHSLVWVVIVAGSALIMAFCHFMGTGNFRAHLAMTATLGASIGLVLFLIVAFDRPFRGGVGIQPDAFVRMQTNIHRMGGE